MIFSLDVPCTDYRTNYYYCSIMVPDVYYIHISGSVLRVYVIVLSMWLFLRRTIFHANLQSIYTTTKNDESPFSMLKFNNGQEHLFVSH